MHAFVVMKEGMDETETLQDRYVHNVLRFLCFPDQQNVSEGTKRMKMRRR